MFFKNTELTAKRFLQEGNASQQTIPYLKREAAMEGHAKPVVAMAEALEEIHRASKY